MKDRIAVLERYAGGGGATGDMLASTYDPATISEQLVGLTATQTLSNKTLTSPSFEGSIDGWVSANESWSYASATTITVPSGAALKYQKGDKIKLTQTTVKYFYIITVADTLLTITGGTSYTLTNAAISANYYSHIENPLGFPGYFDYTPTATSQAGTITSVSAVGKFMIQGLKLSCWVKITITTNGTGSGAVRATLPVAYTNLESVWVGREYNATGKMLQAAPATSVDLYITNYDNSYPGGNGHILLLNGFYQLG